jgi:PKD repeat protein
MGRLCAVLAMAGSLAACTLDSQEAPGLIGPGGSSQQVTVSASPDRLPHDGASQSVVTVTMRNELGQPVSGARMGLSASSGTLSHVDVVTNASGQASFIVTAPALSTPAAKVSIFVTPFGSDADSALTRTVVIDLTGTLNATAPSASFAVATVTPAAGVPTAFDASATTDEGSSCGGCTYSWTFGDGGSGSGRLVTHTYAAPGTFVVTLTVTDTAGTTDTDQLAVTVAAAAEEEDP